jgi:hypothetical protein
MKLPKDLSDDPKDVDVAYAVIPRADYDALVAALRKARIAVDFAVNIDDIRGSIAALQIRDTLAAIDAALAKVAAP